MDRILIATVVVINVERISLNVVIRIMRDDESKGGCNSSKI